jgi:hypothetical protein
MPVLPTAPVVVKNTKLFNVPKLGACAKFMTGEHKKVTDVTTKCRIFFLFILDEA